MDEIESYLAALPDDQRAALTALDKTLRTLLPDAKRVMAYAMPSYKIGKSVVAGYAAFAKHLGFFPHSGNIVPTFAADLDALGYKHSKSGVQFTPAKPIPETLLIRILNDRLREAGHDITLETKRTP